MHECLSVYFCIHVYMSWRIVIFSGTVHWFWLKTSFHPLLWTSSGLTGSWKLSTYIGYNLTYWIFLNPTTNTFHIIYLFDMALSKYGCHLANMSHTPIMLYGHIDPTFFSHMCQTQPTAISTSYVIVIYVPATNVPLKCHICKLFHMHVKQLYQYKYLIWTH